ncbi:MAG: YraN family protein [Bacillota bacterium]|nr:YraN family protein [Bacillota bacterium]
MNNRELGIIGEDTAARLLSCEGYEIVARNYRCRFGEIDIIAYHEDCLHFIEVKTRRGHEYGRPCQSVTYPKQARIRKTAVFYLNEIREKGCRIPQIQFQVIEIVIERIENAF